MTTMIQNSFYIGIAFAFIMGLIALFDLTWRKIPNLIVYPFIVALCVINPMLYVPNLIVGSLVGIIIYKLGFMKQHIAEGDIKIAMIMSTVCGIIGILSFFLGIGIVAWYRNRSGDKDPLPFAPFAMVALVMMFIGDQIIKVIVP